MLSESDEEVVFSEISNSNTEDGIEPSSNSTAVSGSIHGSDDYLQLPKALYRSKHSLSPTHWM